MLENLKRNAEASDRGASYQSGHALRRAPLALPILQAEFEDIVAESHMSSKLNDLESLCMERGLVDGMTGIPVKSSNAALPVAAARQAAYKAKLRELAELRSILQQAQHEEQAGAGGVGTRRLPTEPFLLIFGVLLTQGLLAELAAKRQEALDAATRLAPLSEQLMPVHQASLQYIAKPAQATPVGAMQTPGPK